LTVGNWLAHWLVSRMSPATSTMRSYSAHVRLYLAPYLGPVLLGELSAAHVQAIFTAIVRHHQALGTPVSAATLSRIRATLRAALNAAMRRGLVAENAASRAELPRARRARAVVWTPERVEHWRATGERPGVAVWTAAQTACFLTASASHRLYALYHLIALRGLRRGEAAGLRWCDIDLDARTAVISQQLQQHGGRLEITPPKTAYCARVIALDHTTVAALREHRRRQRAEAAASGPGYQASGYVFTNRRGGPMAPIPASRHGESQGPEKHQAATRAAVPGPPGPPARPPSPPRPRRALLITARQLRTTPLRGHSDPYRRHRKEANRTRTTPGRDSPAGKERCPQGLIRQHNVGSARVNPRERLPAAPYWPQPGPTHDQRSSKCPENHQARAGAPPGTRTLKRYS